jgi:hypothetical protein
METEREKRKWEQQFTQVQKYAMIINYPFVWWSLDESHLIFYRPVSLRRIRLTTSPPSCEPIVLKMWEPRRLTTLWASNGLLQGRYGMDDREIGIRFPGQERDFCLLRNTQNAIEAYPLLQRLLRVVCSPVKRPEREAGHLYSYNG